VTHTGVQLSGVTTDVTDDEEDFDFTVSLMEGGSAVAERMRLTSAGNLSITGDLTVTGNNISGSGGSIIEFSGDDIKFTDNVNLASDVALLSFGDGTAKGAFQGLSSGISVKGLVDSTASSAIATLRLDASSTGTVQAGFGARQAYYIESLGGGHHCASYDVIYTDVTDGGEDA